MACCCPDQYNTIHEKPTQPSLYPVPLAPDKHETQKRVTVGKRDKDRQKPNDSLPLIILYPIGSLKKVYLSK